MNTPSYTDPAVQGIQRSWSSEPVPGPNSTDLAATINQLETVNLRLGNAITAVNGLIERVYGEGETTKAEQQMTPRAVGLLGTLHEEISVTERATVHLESRLARLCKLA